MKEEIEFLIKRACQELFELEPEVNLTRVDEKFGDYSTNVALTLSPKLKQKPSDISQAIIGKLNEFGSGLIQSVSSAGPGFINITLTTSSLYEIVNKKSNKEFSDKQVLVEFGNANPFKEMHLGHVYMSIVGDSVARLFELAGAKVERLSYHGDVGLHVAKTVWAIKKRLGEQADAKLEDIINNKKDIGEFYAYGTKSYEESESDAAEIKLINSLIYSKQDEQIDRIYELGKEVSFSNFDEIFSELNITFSKRYFESVTSQVGLTSVKENIGKVFSESQGAIIFDGESIGLHTRVFINAQGLPTYEAKDLGLAELKDKDYPEAFRSIIITDHQQLEYFKVMLAALKQIKPNLADKTVHITHGHLGLSTGKMSGRSGQVYTAKQFISDIKEAVELAFPETLVKDEIFMAAIRYSLMKQRLGGDIVFDLNESVALEGNSGPYLQYARARAVSIISKAGSTPNQLNVADIDDEERKLLSKISEFSEVCDKAINELMPHHICTYLYELAQSFNRFYENNRVLGDPRQQQRLSLISLYADTIKNGLATLGIPAPDKM